MQRWVFDQTIDGTKTIVLSKNDRDKLLQIKPVKMSYWYLLLEKSKSNATQVQSHLDGEWKRDWATNDGTSTLRTASIKLESNR